jgi:hypothetical protein
MDQRCNRQDPKSGCEAVTFRKLGRRPALPREMCVFEMICVSDDIYKTV